MNPRNQVYLRNFIFGIEDSLVSTVGLLSCIASAGVPRTTIVLTGIVLIFVEAFSMAAGSFLAESSVEEYTRTEKKAAGEAVAGGAIMFFSYFLAGIIPIFPYVASGISNPFAISILASLASLFALGVVSGKLTTGKLLRHGMRMLVIGGIATFVGIIAAEVVRSL